MASPWASCHPGKRGDDGKGGFADGVVRRGLLGRQRRVRPGQHDLQDERAELQRVAVAEGAFFHEPFAVDQRAVGAPQVAHADGLAVDAQQAVLAADQLAVGADVALRATADHKFAFGEVEE